MTIGPSMANLVQYYGHRRAYGLSVSPNPLNRNPSYEPLPNPDQALRDNEIQYVVWDTFSASRSPKLLRANCSATPPATTAGLSTASAPGQRRSRPCGAAAGDRRLRGAPVIARAALALVRRWRARRPGARRRPATPIEHFVVLMQENHSFDNYFGTFPGANGIPASTCMPVGAGSPALCPAVSPRRPCGSDSHDLRTHEAPAATDGRLHPGGLSRPAVSRSAR